MGNETPLLHFGKWIASVRGERTDYRRQCHQAHLRGAAKSSSGVDAVWNSTSTILRAIPWCRMRSSSWNRNVPPAVFRFWHVQLTNWSNRRRRTEGSVGGQTLSHKSARMKAFPTRGRLAITICQAIDPASLRHRGGPRRKANVDCTATEWRDHPTVAARLS